MLFSETKIANAWLIKPQRRADERGHFARVWCEREFLERGLETRLAQANAGFSPARGTLRGMHFQLPPHDEVKVVRCTRGAVYDVVVDLRPQSPTHGQWIAEELSADNGHMLYCPAGCAHGYQTLVDDTELWYQTSQFYAPQAARGVRYNDPAFNITWPLKVTAMSPADLAWPNYEGKG
ncbi:MAG: dTDP-4-dehydrorhamnose 3,5-epimerase [Pirellulales bacterium]